MLYAIGAVLVIIIDQWVKYWVSGAIPMSSAGEPFIPGLISLVNLHNDGAAFGFLSGGNARIYFIIITGVFTLAVILALATNFISGRLGRWCLVLMTAGGLSNCIDRVIYGYVQDMFMFEPLPSFPIFNVADIFITVFCLLFVIAIIFERDKKDELEYDDEYSQLDDEEADRPSFPKFPKKEKAPRKDRKAKAEDEYEQYKAARAERQRQAEPSAPRPARPAPSNTADPFAEWERANAKADAQPKSYASLRENHPDQAQGAYRAPAQAAPQRQPVQQAPYQGQAQPVQRPVPRAPVEQPAARPAARPTAANDDFSLDDILNEFK